MCREGDRALQKMPSIIVANEEHPGYSMEFSLTVDICNTG